MTTIYTSKKTGIAYELEGSHTIEGKTRYTLYSEAEQDRISVTESVLKRWYKKSIEVDFTDAEEKPEEETVEEATEEPVEETPDKEVKFSKKGNYPHKTVSVSEFINSFDSISSIHFENGKVHFMNNDKRAHHPRKAVSDGTSVQFMFKRVNWTVKGVI